MDTLNTHDTLIWIAIIALIALASVTGMYLNRFFIHRAHRKALAELKRRILDDTLGINSDVSEQGSEYIK